jgi:cephalosporin-C deacetylase
MALSLDELEALRSDVKRPEDFDAFWTEQLEALAAVPVEWERSERSTLTAETQKVETLKFLSVDGIWVHAWLTGGYRETSRSAGLVYLPGYSWGNPPPDAHSVYDDVLTLGLNLHGHPSDHAYKHPRSVGGEYITQGIDSPHTYIYKNIILHCLRALEVLAQLDDVDPERVAIGGMSQGGGLSLICAALSSVPKLCFADMPWLCDLDRALSLLDPNRYKPGMPVPDSRNIIRQYANEHPEKADQVYKTYRYFDPLSHASNITIPVQCSAGGRDPSCRPPTIYSVFNEIPTEKEMLYLPNTGHEIVPAMRDAHDRWIRERLI